MTWLNKISIKRRMLLTFALVLFSFIVFAVFSVNEMNELGKLTSTLYEHPLKVSNAALEAQAGVLRIHMGMKDVVVSSTDLELHTAIQAVKVAENDVYERLGIVKRLILGKEGKTLAQEATAIFDGWKPIKEEEVALVLKGDKDAAGRIARGKGADYVSNLNRKMKELASYAQSKADDFMKEAENKQQQILINTVLIIGMVALLSLLITWLITKSILSSVSGLKNTMAEITKTGALVKSGLSGNNEIAQMAQDFNSLIDRLQGQFWFKTGQNTLNNELSGDFTYEAMVAKGLNFISRYVDACTGALYIYDEKLSVCELKASYALVEGKHFSGQFGLGEGIVGQVAIEKKPVLLSGITSEDAQAKTGTVSEPPRSIYAQPLLYEERLYGVLEVALFEEIDPLKIEFLEAAASILSTSIHTATQNVQIINLLKVTQENNEKLQAQAEELQTQTEELQGQTEELQSQTEELKSQSEELQEQNIELEAQRQQVEDANRLKGEFLANMSHELRTPLNSVMALSRVLLSQAKDRLSEEELNYLEIIRSNGKNLLGLINDILDLSKIEAGKMDIRPKPLSLAYLLETIIERLEPVAREKGIQLTHQVSEDLPPIKSDESMVHLIIQNIVSNAVKFTEKGSVSVSANENAGKVVITVADTGIGIAQKDLPYVFDEFRQVDGRASRSYEGTGLGLTLAYKSANMLGGDLAVESVSGKGSVFTLILPVKWEEPVPVHFVEDEQIFEPQQKAPGANGKSDAKATGRILVIEDNEAAIIQVKKMLESQSYRVDLAYNGKDALTYLKRTLPDGIILDLMMPEMDGFELLNRIRANEAMAKIPVLVLTAKALTPEDYRKLNANNISQLIQKGDVDEEELLGKVGLMIG
ncbi:MAG: response regulator [Deltaproteobacteria bacterium]|nr:response regulator [Deltaproteobacteria bacterium]